MRIELTILGLDVFSLDISTGTDDEERTSEHTGSHHDVGFTLGNSMDTES